MNFRNSMKHVVLIAISLFFSLSLVLPRPARAVPARPIPFEVKQPDGAKILLHLRGDEYFHWLEDVDGYTVIKDQSNKYVYAQLNEQSKSLVPMDLEVGKVVPAAKGLTRGILPPRETIRQIRRSKAPKNSWENLKRAQPVAKTTSISATDKDGVIESMAPPTAKIVKNLVVLCVFNDHYDSNNPDFINQFTRPAHEYDPLFNWNSFSPGSFVLGNTHPNAPTGSVRDFYWYNSQGQILIQSGFVTQPDGEKIWVKLPEDEIYYSTETSNGKPREMVTDALDRADLLVDFSDYDSDGDGMIDAITIIHSGWGAEAGGGGVWSHKWSLAEPWISAEGVKVQDYHTEPALAGNEGTNIVTIGVICHELGHYFGLPDLYDIYPPGEGIGSYGVMANSWGFGGNGISPPHFSPWSRFVLGWIEPFIINDQPEIDIWGEYRISDWDTHINDNAPEGVHPVYMIDLLEKVDFQVAAVDPIMASLILSNVVVGNGINIANETYTGGAESGGIFVGGKKAGLAMDTGIVLTTGSVFNMLPPNTNDTDLEVGGTPPDDEDLRELFNRDPNTLVDVCAFEFDFSTSQKGDLKIKYVFASEEYNERAIDYPKWSDAFAIILWDIEADEEDEESYELVNRRIISLVPGTDTPVSLHTVNGGNPFGEDAANPEYFRNNDLSDGGPFYNIEYDGFTLTPDNKPLEAIVEDLPPGNYHVKMVVADWYFPGPSEIPSPDDPSPEPMGGSDDSALFVQTITLDTGDYKQDWLDRSEYLLVENRQPSGFETTMPQGGLAIWHIDNRSLYGSFAYNDINAFEGYPGQLIAEMEWPWTGTHYQVALLQADGQYELERSFHRGEGDELFHGEKSSFINRCGILNPEYDPAQLLVDPDYAETYYLTYPNTDSYIYGLVTETDISISDISVAAPVMTFTYRGRIEYNDDINRAIPVEEGEWIEETQSWFIQGNTGHTSDEMSYMFGERDMCGVLPTGDHVSVCSGFDPFDIWHTFTPTEAGTYTIDCCSTSVKFDTVIEVMVDPNALADSDLILGCNDDVEPDSDCYYQSRLHVYLPYPGHTYYLRISGYNEEMGDYSLTVSPTYQPDNDACQNPAVINNGVPYAGTTIGATGDLPSGYGVDDYFDTWHVFTPAQTGTVTVSLCDTEPYDEFDMTLAVYADCNEVKPPLAGNDDFCGVKSQLKMTMQQEQSYLIRVSGNDYSSGKYILTIDQAPENDMCADALPVADFEEYGNTYSGTTEGANPTGVLNGVNQDTAALDNAELVSSCAGNDRMDVWYKYAPVVDGPVTITLCGSDPEFDTTLAVYDACNGTELACNDDYCDSLSGLTMDMVSNEIYLIRIAGWDDTVGDYVLKVSGGLGDGIMPPRIDPPYSKEFVINRDIGQNGCLTAQNGITPLTWTVVFDEQILPYAFGSRGSLALVGAAQGFNGDDIMFPTGGGRYNLPFSFPFYGKNYDSVKICSNGFLELGDAVSASPTDSLEDLKQNVRIAPLWDDLRTDQYASEDIYIQDNIAGQVTFRWQASLWWPENHQCNFAATLFADGRIRFDYGSGNNAVTPTIGISAGNNADYAYVSEHSSNIPLSLADANSVLFEPTSLQESPFPPGVDLLPSGCLTGRPTTLGNYPVTIRVTDSSAPGKYDTKEFEFFVVNNEFDLNSDGTVNLIDLSVYCNHWLRDDCTKPTNCDMADVNEDGIVDLADLNQFLENWLAKE